ncbi:hypothetical protein A4X13_0g8998, partial [Tilletia indica]
SYLSFSVDLRLEDSVDAQRLRSGAKLAQQADTSSQFPLLLSLDGKLPTPAPEGTNWDGVRELVTDVRVQSLKASVQRRQQLEHRPRTSSLPPVPAQELGSSLPPRTYAELVADLCPLSQPVGSDVPSAITLSALEEGPSTSSHSPALDTSTSPFTSVLGQDSSPSPSTSLQPLSYTASYSMPRIGGNTCSSSMHVDGLAVALSRIRQGWIDARRALGVTDVPVSSYPATPPLPSSRTATARFYSIERVQQQLRALLSSTPRSAHLTSILVPGRDGSADAWESAASGITASPVQPLAPTTPNHNAVAHVASTLPVVASWFGPPAQALLMSPQPDLPYPIAPLSHPHPHHVFIPPPALASPLHRIFSFVATLSYSPLPPSRYFSSLLH